MTTNLKITNIRARPVLAPFKRPPIDRERQHAGGRHGADRSGNRWRHHRPLLRVRLRDLDAQTHHRLRRSDAGHDQRRRAGAVRDRSQAAQAPDAARHARSGRARARRDRHGRLGCAGPGQRRAAGQAAGRRSQAGARLQQLRPVDPTGGERRRRSGEARRRGQFQRRQAAPRARRSGAGSGGGARGEKARGRSHQRDVATSTSA